MARLQQTNAALERALEARTAELAAALERQTATGEILSAISRSPTLLQPVLDTIVTTAARLCHAEWAVIFRLEGNGRYHLAAAFMPDGLIPDCFAAIGARTAPGPCQL